MRYVKAALVGVTWAIVSAVLWIVVSFLLPLYLPLLTRRLSDDGIGVVGVGFITSGSILLAALVGFVIGCGRGLRRFRAVS